MILPILFGVLAMLAFDEEKKPVVPVAPKSDEPEKREAPKTESEPVKESAS